MLPLFRTIFLVVGVLAAALPAARGQALSATDREAAHAALVAARNGDWSQAYADLAPVKDPLPLKVVRWMDYTRSSATGRFAEITRFIVDNPGWPSQKRLRRQAEAALRGESDQTVADWFGRYPPLSAVGKARAAAIRIARGDTAGGTAALRAAWVDGDFNPTDERDFIAQYGALIRPKDNVRRLDRLLWEGHAEAARRLLPQVPADDQALAAARLALAAMTPNLDAALAQVPAALRGDAGLRFETVRWRRRHDMTDAAAQMLRARPGDPSHPDTWWGERQIIARQLLGLGNAALAYRIVEQHGALSDGPLSEAEFLAGFITLRYQKNPALAFAHFARVLARATSPYAEARAAYWGGRAAAAEAKPALAEKWYAAGADHMATFYGQLCAHQLGDDAPPHPLPEPRPSAAERARFSKLELVRAAALFFDAGDRARARLFVLHQTKDAKRPVDFAMLADFAQAHGRTDLAIAVATRAVNAGMPLTTHGYPVTAIPPGGTTEHALLLAIMRQESGFAIDAISRAGARGLMQLMPATARAIASKLQLPFSATRLTVDGVYNVLLGRAYLEKLIDEFGGSYGLAIAAYNAGPGKVRQWLHEFGDPRSPAIGMVDWLELIPYRETRVYVQRVLENLQTYRAQIGNASSTFSLVSDLAR